MKVSELMIECLENEGVQYIFGVPGEENEDLMFALEGSSVEFIPTRHEQGAAFMANVWGRLTGRAGVCLATLGPGATNLLTGIADANLDKSPVVAVTGQGGLERMHHESHQYLDVVDMFKPVTKWNTGISSPNVVNEVVRKAFKVAECEKPGATHIEVSEDIARMEVDHHMAPLSRVMVRRPGPDPKALGEALEMILSAERPLILAGNGAIRKRASQGLRDLVEDLDIPVASTFMGKGAISDDDQHSLMTVGLGFVRDHVMEAFELADVVITIGYDVAELSPDLWNPGRDKRIVHIDFTPAEVYTHYIPAVEVVGDISATVRELHDRISHGKPSHWRDWYIPVRERIIDDISGYDLVEGDPFTVPGVLNIVREVMDPEGLLISDVGAHKVWVARNFRTFVPNGCIMSNGLASMGISLPGAIAASLVDPERQVVAVMGDGGFMMNSQELETAVRVGASFVVLVVNDNDFGLISWKQRLHRGRSTGTGIGNPDFVAVARAFDIEAHRPSGVSELRAALATSLGSDGVTLIEVPVDSSVNDGLSLKMDEYWGMSS